MSEDVEYFKSLGYRFPYLYHHKNAHEVPMAFIWNEIDKGWRGIIEELSVKLETLLLTLPEEKRKCVQVSQVKQKFGHLNFNYKVNNEEDFAPISNEFWQEKLLAEDKAANVCEICGESPATTFGYGYIRTLCLRHKEDYLTELLQDVVNGAQRSFVRGDALSMGQLRGLEYAARTLKETREALKKDAGN